MMIPSPQDSKIKVLAFDQGGIYIGVDYDATLRAFEALGVKNAHELYTQADQSKPIDDFERGAISSQAFYQYLREALFPLDKTVSDEVLYEAWNAMLINVNKPVLEMIGEFRRAGYMTVVLSNADEIHQQGVEKLLEEASALDLFKNSAFDERYISYEIGYNKPYVDIFQAIANTLQQKYAHQSILSHEILFVDDSEKHIVGRNENEGALNAGWQGLFVPSNLSSEHLKRHVIDKLNQLSD